MEASARNSNFAKLQACSRNTAKERHRKYTFLDKTVRRRLMFIAIIWKTNGHLVRILE